MTYILLIITAGKRDALNKQTLKIHSLPSWNKLKLLMFIIIENDNTLNISVYSGRQLCSIVRFFCVNSLASFQ